MAGDVRRLVEQARAGDARAVGRLISIVENSAPGSARLREVVELLDASTDAELIGITGPPGVGKSSLVSALVTAYRAAGKRVGVLAVDPTSPFTSGALLGDRVRMQDHATDRGVFIRSMATRGHLGGLARATPQAIRVLRTAGCDVILLETVGVGQSEVEVAGLADTTLVLLSPGLGDAVQIAKAGVLEVGDVFVVNKADRDGAERVTRDLRQMLALDASGNAWTPPIVKTVAVPTGAEGPTGIDKVLEAISRHREHLVSSGDLERRRREWAYREIEALVVARVRARIDPDVLERLVIDVVSGTLDPYAAADKATAGWEG